MHACISAIGRVLNKRFRQSHWVAAAALGLTLIILGLTVAVGMLHLRRHLREHLVQRDGNILKAVALARQYANGSGSNLTQRLSNPADQLALVLEISQIKEGVLGVRLFDSDGQFETAFPPTLLATNLAQADLAPLRQLQAVSHFHDRADLGRYFLTVDAALPGTTMPLLEVTIPLHPRNAPVLVANAQLLLDGRPLAAEYARVDEHLWPLGLGLFFGGALSLLAVWGWAYRKLRHANRLVEERTQRLLRANHEMALAAKTNALGPVAAHLVHGLSNPLANLQDFLREHGQRGDPCDLMPVAVSARRMEQLLQQVVSVLGEERAGERYELALHELAEVLNTRLRASVEASGVHLLTVLDTAGTLCNRDANLALLILENLVSNALTVTPRGGVVRIRIHADQGLCFEVRDQGPGVDPHVLGRLFTPGHSTHGGCGLGLAISKQLANQLNAVLKLASNSDRGCVFSLTLCGTSAPEPGRLAIHQN